MIIDIYGQNLIASSRNVTLIGSLSKMLLDWPWRSIISYMIWKDMVTNHKHILYRLVPLTRRTDGTGYGLLPTLCASDAKRSC